MWPNTVSRRRQGQGGGAQSAQAAALAHHPPGPAGTLQRLQREVTRQIEVALDGLPTSA